jgi:hypothetical protein
MVARQSPARRRGQGKSTRPPARSRTPASGRQQKRGAAAFGGSRSRSSRSARSSIRPWKQTSERRSTPACRRMQGSEGGVQIAAVHRQVAYHAGVCSLNADDAFVANPIVPADGAQMMRALVLVLVSDEPSSRAALQVRAHFAPLSRSAGAQVSLSSRPADESFGSGTVALCDSISCRNAETFGEGVAPARAHSVAYMATWRRCAFDLPLAPTCGSAAADRRAD